MLIKKRIFRAFRGGRGIATWSDRDTSYSGKERRVTGGVGVGW